MLWLCLAFVRRVVGSCDAGVGEESARYERARLDCADGLERCHFAASVSAIAVDCLIVGSNAVRWEATGQLQGPGLKGQ